MADSKMSRAEQQFQSHSDATRDALIREQIRQEEAARKAEHFTKWAALETNMRNKTIITGIISGVNTKSNTSDVLVEVTIDEFTCTIPFGEIYRTNPIDRKTCVDDKEYRKRQLQMSRKLLGAKTQLMVLAMKRGDTDDLDDYAIVGSRKQALEIMEKANFAPRRNGKTIMNEGDFVRGIITAVGPNSINLNVGGVDTSVQKWALTFQPIPDLRDAYAAGQELLVQIQKISENNGHYSLAVSGKATELEKAKLSTKKLAPGTICQGTVTSIRVENGSVKIWCWLNIYKRPARAEFIQGKALYQQVRHGSTVQLSVIEEAASGMIKCRVIGTNSPNGI